MKLLRSKIKYSTLLLLMLTLHIMLQAVVMSTPDLSSPLERATYQQSDANGDDGKQAQEGSCKPPKNSFIDYSSFFSPKLFLPAYAPNVTAFLTHEQFRVHPPVYLEIIVPPDILA